MKGHPWRPVLRFGLLRCESEVWNRRHKLSYCSAQATRFIAWDGGTAAICEWHAAEWNAAKWRFSRSPTSFQEMSREEWEVCRVQES